MEWQQGSPIAQTHLVGEAVTRWEATRAKQYMPRSMRFLTAMM